MQLLGGSLKKVVITITLVLLLVFYLGLSIWWSCEPNLFDVRQVAITKAQQMNTQPVVGFYTTNTLISVLDVLLNKPGGYLSNDRFPPGIWLDNMPSWEFGALVQVRDLSRVLRKDFSRSQSQSTEDPDIAVAEPKLHFDHNSWWFPATESHYAHGQASLQKYLQRIADPAQGNSQFFARADNLRRWLAEVETRLGSLSQRLSASVGRRSLNIDLAGDEVAQQATRSATELEVTTPWLEIDNVFYEARGSAWALILFLEAVAIDFADVLEKKNAVVSVKQIIRDLEATQEPLWSPIVLNGSGLGMLANHSLVMANYISRANAAIIDLRELLEQG